MQGKNYRRYKKLLKWSAGFTDVPDDYFWNLYERRRYGRYGRKRLQETFNVAARHLVRQNKRSERKGYGKMYRGPDGLKCPIGVLISDRDYDKQRMEGTSCDSGAVAAALLRAGHDLDICKKLQKIHDEVPPKLWDRALNRLAYDLGLEGVKRDWTFKRKKEDAPTVQN